MAEEITGPSHILLTHSPLAPFKYLHESSMFDRSRPILGKLVTGPYHDKSGSFSHPAHSYQPHPPFYVKGIFMGIKCILTSPRIRGISDIG
jgi:hypothetical protein